MERSAKSSSRTTPSNPAPPDSGNAPSEAGQRTVCPGPNQVTACHGYSASQANTRATSAGLAEVPTATASSTRAYADGLSSTCSTTGIRWQLIPTVLSTG